MTFAEVTAVDADSSSSSSFLSLFVHCIRTNVPLASSFNALHVQLVDPPMLYEADVAAHQKPRALDCSGIEYVAAVESALIASSIGQTSRFEFRWSKQKRSLILMERAEFAMKFCAVDFRVSEDAATWREMLHQVAMQEREHVKLIAETESKVTHCETLLGRKEALLETALTAKQKVEDELFRGFCTVLNAKKDEIRKLQLEVDKARDMHKDEMKPTKKRKVAAPKGKKKVTGAKLKKKMEEEEEDEEMSDGSNKGNAMDSEEDEDDGIERNRAKNDAIKAYSALPGNLRSSSVQISSADDVLSRMDELIKNEEEENEAMQREGDSRDGRSELVGKKLQGELSKPRTRKTAALEVEPTPSTEPVLPLVLQVDEAMDPEEVDILDMLS